MKPTLFFAIAGAVVGMQWNAQAGRLGDRDHRIVAIESSYPSGYQAELIGHLDEERSGIQSFIYSDSRGVRKEYTVAEVNEGVVLIEAQGKSIVSLTAPGFRGTEGGPLLLQFRRRFTGSDIRQVNFEYHRVGSIDEWEIRTNDKQGRDLFDHIGILIDKTFGIPMGVKRVNLDYQGKRIRSYDPTDLPGARRVWGALDFFQLPE